MKNSTRKFLLVGLLFLAAVVILATPMLTVDVSSQSQRAFVLDAKMPRVRKILVRTNAVKKIVAMAQATLLDQEWQNMAFGSNKPLIQGDWHMSGQGSLSIQVNDSYLGEQSIQLDQTVDVTPDRLYSTNDLAQPSDSIREYSSTLELVPDSDRNARVECSLKIRIRTTASLLTRHIVEREIKASAARSLENQETAIRELVAEHAGKLIILPNFNRE